MRPEVIELEKLGPLPSFDVVLRDTLDNLVERYEELITFVESPVTDDEARVLVKLFSPDDCFGLDWTLVTLVESAPGWPIPDCLENTSNSWIRLLRQRLRNSGFPY